MEKSTNTPLHIVMTPVRNEAWVLRAFLEATSLWADYIIIADQMSTDGSREIAQEYPKVILIDNNRPEMHMAATRRLLFEEAKKIEGNKILFALDADEFLSGDFIHTADWKRITDSKPDDSFCWRWMNLKRDDATKYSTFQHYYWAVHDSEVLWQGEFPDNFIHEWRLPWSPKADAEHKFLLNDFCSIHLARVNQNRQKNKERFYQVSTVGQNPKTSKVSLYRSYHVEEKLEYFDVPKDAYSFYEDHGLDLWEFIDLSDEGEYYTSETLSYFQRDGVKKYALLDIWDKDWIVKNGLKDPRNMFHKLLIGYLKKTNPYAKSIWVRCLDKILKLIA
ncbi:MAG: glycosyltransferase family 2 protein [Bacteroidales bacterium]|nr:glycosyltransferase family 2 protein [Bacteroidales bacterium]